jgi:hypothetical protein
MHEIRALVRTTLIYSSTVYISCSRGAQAETLIKTRAGKQQQHQHNYWSQQQHPFSPLVFMYTITSAIAATGPSLLPISP